MANNNNFSNINKGKIEFYVNRSEKERFQELCEKYSYTIAELMRRAFEEKMEWLEGKEK